MSAAPNRTPLEELDIDIKCSIWIFISASFDDRHLHDLVWGCEALRARGVPDKNILIFSDHLSPETILTHFRLMGCHKPLTTLQQEIAAISNYEFAFIVTSGHGSSEAMEHKSGIRVKAHDLLESVRKIQGLKRGFIILGQCYSGIFDGLEASKFPEIGLMGGTKLNLSISDTSPTLTHDVKLQSPQTDADGATTIKDLSWMTNIFIFHLFAWIRNPVDTDGDGKISLLDAFKYAGAKSNDNIRTMRLFRSLNINPKYDNARKKVKDHYDNVTPLDAIEFQTQISILENEATFLYFHQEPWILHTNLIRLSVLKA